MYKVYTVYETDKTIRYYVINTKTNKIQSRWLNWIDARDTVNDLNRSQNANKQGSR